MMEDFQADRSDEVVISKQNVEKKKEHIALGLWYLIQNIWAGKYP